jgi:DNA-binding transcriptional MocR family regulator
MVRELKAHMPEAVRFVEPHGGFFVWLELPADTPMPTLLQNAGDAGLLLQPGTRFSISGSSANCLRLCFACHSEARIREGCKRLGEVVRRLRL